MKRVLLLAVALPFLACSDSSGPETDLNGNWRFTYGPMTGTYIGLSVTCNVDPADFVITQSGSSFSGTQTGGADVTCAAGPQTLIDTTLTEVEITAGQISGSTATFQYTQFPGTNTANVSGNSMSGSSQWLFAQGSLGVTLTGQFTAARN